MTDPLIAGAAAKPREWDIGNRTLIISAGQRHALGVLNARYPLLLPVRSVLEFDDVLDDQRIAGVGVIAELVLFTGRGQLPRRLPATCGPAPDRSPAPASSGWGRHGGPKGGAAGWSSPAANHRAAGHPAGAAAVIGSHPGWLTRCRAARSGRQGEPP
ncbi:MAG: hypothetical protein ACREOE_08660 [Gemmatimonadales bacterium]